MMALWGPVQFLMLFVPLLTGAALTGSEKLIITPSNGNVVLGESRTFTCKVEKGGADSILWYNSTGDVVENTDHIEVESNQYQSQLKIINADPEVNGMYWCEAGQDKDEDLVKFITISVIHIPTFESAERQVLYSWLGNPVNISCTVRANPEPNITWSRNSLDLGNIGDISKNSTAIRSVLQLRVRSPDEFSEYQCTATNAQGSASHTVQLREGEFPGIPRDLRAEPRSTTVRVAFDPPKEDSGIPVLGYWLEWRQNSSWEWNRTRIDNEYYLVTGLQPYTPYQFRVSAINGRGDGNYSDIVSARTLSILMSSAPRPIGGEPDRPSVSTGNESTGNDIWIFFKDVENGGRPVLRHFIRYKEVEADQWCNVTVNYSSSNSYLLENLNWGSVYELEIEAENSNGRSVTTYLNVSIPQRSPTAAVGEKPVIEERIGTFSNTHLIIVIIIVLSILLVIILLVVRRKGDSADARNPEEPAQDAGGTQQ